MLNKLAFKTPKKDFLRLFKLSGSMILTKILTKNVVSILSIGQKKEVLMLPVPWYSVLRNFRLISKIDIK